MPQWKSASQIEAAAIAKRFLFAKNGILHLNWYVTAEQHEQNR